MLSNISTKTGNLFDKGIKRPFYRQEIAIMFKIVRFPKKLESFVDTHGQARGTLPFGLLEGH